MKISLCIPHYNRIEFLQVVLDSIAAQTYQDLEVIVSDDCSSDDSERVLMSMKTSFRVPLIYERQKSNIGYDANLRRSMELASGDYLFVLGNDDALNDHQAIDQLVTSILRAGSPASYLQLPGIFGFFNCVQKGVGRICCARNCGISHEQLQLFQFCRRNWIQA